MMRKILGRILCAEKNKQKVMNVGEIVRAVTQYVARSSGKVMGLLMELIACFD